MASPVPSGAHEWVSFPDPDEDRTWVFDVTFLESTWTCIFGHGCQGVLTGPAAELDPGMLLLRCPLHRKGGLKRVSAAAATLTDEQWQYRYKALPKGQRTRSLRFTAHGQGRIAHDPDGRRSLHLLEPPGFPRRSRLRASPGRPRPSDSSRSS